MSKKEELLNLIKTSNLEEGDVKEWENMIGPSPEPFAESFLELFNKFPEEIVWFTGIFKRKKEAYEILKSDKDMGQRLLDALLEEEKIKIEELANKINGQNYGNV